MAFVTPFVCIIGAPRSGTTWLQAMLGAHPLIATAQELKVFDLFTGPWERSWQRLIELERAAGGGPRGLRIVWSDGDFDDFMTELLERVYGRVLAAKPGATIVLDKSPGYSTYVGHIRRLAPQVKFVHVLRDGRDVATSLRVAARRWARLWAPSTVDGAATLWKRMVSAAAEARQLGAEGYLEIRYEDLLADGPALLRRAFEFIGVAATDPDAAAIYEAHGFATMKAARGYPFDLPREFFHEGRTGRWRDELTARERYAFHEAAGDLLCALGYAEPSWWVERGYQRWLVPPLAGFGARRRLRGVAAWLRRTRGAPDTEASSMHSVNVSRAPRAASRRPPQAVS